MPSGDAFQSAAFITFLSIFGLNPLYLILFHIGVCVGRVYYLRVVSFYYCCLKLCFDLLYY